MVRISFYWAALALLCASCCASSQYRDPRFLHTRNFWDGFERGLTQAGAEVHKRLDSSLRPIREQLSLLDSMSRRIEDQVQESLPSWMGLKPTERQPEPEGRIEAVMGSLGDHAVDDGLKVYMEGDPDDSPHIIPKDSYNEFLSEPEDEEPIPEYTEVVEEKPVPSPPQRPQNGEDSIFNFRFGFGDRVGPRFPFPGLSSGSPFWWTRSNRQKPWWQGENVCIEETEIGEPENQADGEAPQENVSVVIQDGEIDVGSELETGKENRTGRGFLFGEMEIRSCGETPQTYMCTTKTRRRGISRTVKKEYRCCHGFVRQENGCTKIDVKSMTESLKNLGMEQFLTNAAAHGFTSELLNSRNLTVFAPSDEAFSDFISDVQEKNDLDITNNEVFRRKRSHDDTDLASIINTHIASGFYYEGDLKDEQIIMPMAGSTPMRINIYQSQSPPILTMNCARVTSKNLHTEKGVIHTLDRVAHPAKKSIGDIISNDPQFTTLKKLVSESGLLQQLRDNQGQLTLLAPTDAAFAALPDFELEVLTKSACLPAILKNHLLPNVICSAAIVNPEAKTKNLLDKFLKVRLEDTGKIFVEDAQVVAKDIIATNGIIHIIDAPIMPSEAKSVLDVLESKNLTKFLELIRLAEMTEELENLNDVTVFAPSNNALADEEFFDELKNNPERLKSILRYHITSEPITDSSIRNNHMADTQAGHPVRMNLYAGPMVLNLRNLFSRVPQRMRLTAGCSRVTLLDSRACGASIHVLDSLLEPPRDDVMSALEKEAAFSIFAKMAKESSMGEEFLSGEGPFTILAPTDHVFKTLPEKELESLLNDAELKEELVKRHTLREHVCCSGISPISLFREYSRSAHGSLVHLHQSPSGLLKAGPARINECGKPSQNGIVHTVNSLLVEPHVVDGNANRRWGQDRVQYVPLRIPSIENIFGF